MAEVFFNGPAGRIEGRYHTHSDSHNAPIALVLHPHPQHGGTMHNKVAHNIHRTFTEEGFNTLSINFRGVGLSEGQYDGGEGELSDAAAAMDWLEANNPNASSCWVAGFSFGAWISMQLLMRRPEINKFVAVSPPANMYDFSFLAPCPVSGLIIQGTSDQIVNCSAVAALAKRLSSQRGLQMDYCEVDGASHFFNDHMDMLKSRISDYIHRWTPPLKMKKAANF